MKISIITPVYNSVSTIQKTIDSVVLEKEKHDIEYIVIDGGSNDGTLDVLKKNFVYIDKVISEKDRGVHDAINKGIKISSGDYIFILAADDILIKGGIDNFCDNLDEEADVWCGSIIVCDNNNNYYLDYSEENLNNLFYHSSLRHPASFFKRDIFNKICYYDPDLKIAGDWMLFLTFFKNGAKFHIDTHPIVFFSKNGISSGKNFDLKERESLKILKYAGASQEYIENYIKSLNKDFRRSSSFFRKCTIFLLRRLYLYNIAKKIIYPNRVYLSKNDVINYGLK
ncbi:glycosyltransferase family 2 protein [Succinivibrio dextrinosolvens]|uniref:glycosyltransferase family 2 protein n=1 Tax=Succinivibrio dextrinosolvens TaxID=83771 RepID=UPI00068D22B8|nr:glycosyltransferase family 2 protein [Succinivibrio dextrinosolvens]